MLKKLYDFLIKLNFFNNLNGSGTLYNIKFSLKTNQFLFNTIINFNLNQYEI